MAKKKFYRPVLYALLIGAKTLFSLLPLRAGIAFGGFIGRLAFFIPKERKKTLEHLRMAFPEKPDSELKALGSRVFENYGYMTAELALLDKIIPRLEEFVTIEGRELMEAELARGKGILGVLAHFGNWELMGGTLALFGYPVHCIARRIYYDKYDEELLKVRTKMKVHTIYRENSVRALPKALKHGDIVGIVVDQDIEWAGGVFADFFGRPAYSMAAPVRFAQAAGAPLMPIFMVREGLRHRMIIEPRIEFVDTGDREKDLLTNTQRWVSVQERFIRKYPHLWVWNHKRWKTAPKTPISLEKTA